METIYIHYNGTGIKTLRAISNVILVLGLLAALILFIACFEREFLWQQLPSVLLTLLSTLLFSGLCRTIATIAENSIHANEQRKALLKKEGVELIIFGR
jgi:energy-coupling factor transporter transmembrane protein EcfT